MFNIYILNVIGHLWLLRNKMWLPLKPEAQAQTKVRGCVF